MTTISLGPEYYENAYGKYIHRRWTDTSIPYDPLPYGEYIFRGDVQPGDGLRWGFQRYAEHYARELLNELHVFLRILRDHSVWNQLLPEYTEIERNGLIIEFVEVKAKFALNIPYSLKNKFIYSGTMLAILEKGSKSMPQIPRAEEINYRALEKWMGDWVGFHELSTALARLNSKTFASISRNYRHRSQHQIPPNIELGYTPDPSMRANSEGISVDFGGEKPIQINEIMPPLLEQYKAAAEVMKMFWKAMIMADNNWNISK